MSFCSYEEPMHKSLKEATICMVVWIETDLKSRHPAR